jgi:hypothetical protein
MKALSIVIICLCMIGLWLIGTWRDQAAENK